MTLPPRRIGILGAGKIGCAIHDALAATEGVEVVYMLAGRRRPEAVPEGRILTDPGAALSQEVDLVIEAAVPELIRDHAAAILAKSDLCAFSATALSLPETETAVRAACAAHGTRFFVPHGAVMALDGLCDGRDAIGRVAVTTVKSGPSLGLAEDAEGPLFEGSAREACRRFPRNVNVHAAVALAGIGFDRTESRVVAEPGKATMEHHIHVEGQGLAWDIRVASHALGGVSGAYTPRSAVGSVRRILGGAGVTIA
ncbi:aspartate dehydrogenase domain-containing protein [Celeribacter indicus]|uniref:Dinucleotide-utilizing enzyme n=1 Tax=Celeribacter indicus TaxID=1208324 RepID=A0A0B5E357_9RHOB|nr:aspartate dehydrogenase domain-containing protein [Celeribacter indicus]AJE46872.1 dinucleotide-utilizing enzyme [Celeribacter indicus]SDW79772.1 aspartate dehydrogenase [Celeribacter indicus]